MTWQIWLAIASIVFIVFGLVKRLETRMLLIVAGFILCCASGAPISFRSFRQRNDEHHARPCYLLGNGLCVCCSASKCDQHLVAAVAAPLKSLADC